LLSTDEKIYNGTVYEFVLHNGFLPTHVVEIFNSLQTQEKLLVLSDNNERIRKGAFYISYENYKSSPKKVYFKNK